MLAKPTCLLSGVGIHSGKFASVQIFPSTLREGIYFQREDKLTPARYDQVSNAHLLKTELHGGFQTVEHVLAALFGLNITNAVIKVQGETGELPILDGSSQQFCQALLEAGICPATPSKRVKIPSVVEVSGQHGAFCRFLPPTHDDDILHFDLSVEFSRAVERFTYVHDYSKISPVFLEEIAPAKTFCMECEVARMQSMGLGLGGNAENCVVYADNGQASPNLQRVKHKLLDLIGDLSLCGSNVHLVGRIEANRSGHALNHLAVCKLMEKLKT